MPLHCWGSSAFGQLGLGESVLEEGKVLSPVSHGYFSNDRTVLDIGCGLHHTVFVLEDGTIWTCGSNDEAQLGRDSPIELGQVFALELHRIIGVSCGDFHTLVINDKYSVFSWGNDQYGQCGRGGISLEPKPIPRLIKSLEDMRVVQVACGSSHSLALTTNGQIYAWGANDHGQLGLGSKESMSKPTLVSSLQGLPVKQITCGRSHSFALSVSGAVFGWGNNSCGQLGLNDERGKHSVPVNSA
uniref:Probable E3 ubiquitin-protein ligase HERC4-like n=1 Tax=Saccoglossus kowalevskii TaxID=10224 RepID=A0ABM0MFC4_SACKO|nr:PREDICTED: probable E3 ubiquitin-protein ligase HERC4-like [Saccoglossus kowalevskii]